MSSLPSLSPSPGPSADHRDDQSAPVVAPQHQIFASISPFTNAQSLPPRSPRVQSLSASPRNREQSPREKRVLFLSPVGGTPNALLPRRMSPHSPRAAVSRADPRSRSPSANMLRSPQHASHPEMGSRGLPHFFNHHLAEPSSSSSYSPSVKGGPRRTSRFDPMGGDDEQDVEGYDELGHRHPLRRVKEEGSEEERGMTVSLPGIRSLFTVADQPGASSSRPTLFQTPSLPSLVPGSPSTSPSTARTSRYNSHGSSISALSEPMQSPAWWATDADRSGMMMPTFPHPPPSAARSATVGGYPVRPHLIEEPDSKRRRSDQPPSMRDPDEAARMRWQAQSRNASFPARQNSLPGPSAAMPPPAFARHSISGQVAESHQPSSSDSSRRPSNIPRSASIVGGQLSKSFADLSAADRASPSSPRPILPSPLSDRKPALFAPSDSPGDRRPSMLKHPSEGGAPITPVDAAQTLPMPLNARSRSATNLRGLTPTGSSAAEDSASLRRHCLTRPPSPDPSSRPTLRRSSLTESIMLRMGDADHMGAPPMRHARGSIDMDKPSFSEPMPAYPVDRRQSADSVRSGRSVRLNSDGEIYPGGTLDMRGRKRSADGRIAMPFDEDMEVDVPEGRHSGMDVLAESARRAQAAAADEDRQQAHGLRGEDESGDRDLSPGRSGAMGQAGPRYTCSFCSKQFSRPSSLRIHTYSHTGERPFVCKEPTCRRRFSVQSNLKRHAKVHQMGGAGQTGPMHQMSHHGVLGGAPGHHQHIVHPHPSPRHHPMGGPLSAPLPLQHPSGYPGGSGPRHMHPPPMTGYLPGHATHHHPGGGGSGGYFDRAAPPHAGAIGQHPHGQPPPRGTPYGDPVAGYRGGRPGPSEEEWEEEEEEPEEDELDEEE